MPAESIEELKARIKRQDEEQEETFQKRLEEIREANAPWRAEQEAKKRAEEQKRQELFDGARQKREQEMKDSARMAWLDAGGTEEEFEQEWPSLRTEMLRQQTLERQTNIRAAQSRSGISSL